jgi:tRNA(Ile)-lysidine synthase
MANTEVSLSAYTILQLLKLGATRKSRVLLAVSGGIDSITLFHVLAKEKDRYGELAVVHVNHQLRGEDSHRDEAFVQSACKRHELACYVKQVFTAENAEKGRRGIEETARDDRYDFFEEISAREGYDLIVTAHTKNDQAETLLMRLMRGAGTRGLAGIPKTRKLGNAMIIRPWLDVSREQIERFAKENSIEHRNDSTNSEKHFTRNRVRHELLPLMETIAGVGVMDRIADTATHYRTKFESTLTGADRIATDALIEKGRFVTLDLRGMNASDEVLHLLIERTLAKALRRKYYLEREPFERIKAFLKEDGEEDWIGELRMKSSNGKLLLKRKADETDYEFALILDSDIETPFGVIRATVSSQTEPIEEKDVSQFDMSALTGELIVRNWRAGETIEPFGLDGSKTISKLLTDAKLSAWDGKAVYPVLVHRRDGKDEILSVPGIRRSKHAPLNEGTKAVLEVRFILP